MRKRCSFQSGQRLAGAISGICQVGLLTALLVSVLALVAAPASAQEGPDLEWTIPSASELVSESPSEIRLGFSEALDPERSHVTVRDRSGDPILDGGTVEEERPHELLLPVSQALPDDVYTVAWQTAILGNESERSGYFAFEIGDAGALPSTPPESQLGESATSMPALSRILMLLGTTGATGLLFFWLVALRPMLQQAGGPVRPIGSRVRLVTGVALLISAAGAGIGLLDELSRSSSSLLDVLTETATGSSLLLQAAHLLLFGGVLAIPGIWRPRTGWRIPAVSLVVAGAAMLPLAISSHSGQQLVGTAPATANQWLHLLGMSAWTGGLLAAGIITLWFRTLWVDEAGRAIARRIGFLVLGSIPVLGLTGLYAFQLNTGSLTALRTTDFGEVLAIKLVLSGLAALFGLAVVLGWRFRPAMVHPSRAGAIGLPVVALLVVGIASVAGMLSTHEQTAREEFLAAQERQAHEFVVEDMHGALYITPGIPGHNRMTLDLSAPGATLSDTAQTALRLTSDEPIGEERQVVLHPEDICTADGEIIESPVARFEAEGLDLSVQGSWSVDVVVQRIDGPSATVPVDLELGDPGEDHDGLAPPLRFTGVQATLGFLSGAGVLLLGGIVIARYRRDGRLPDVLSLLTMVMLVFTVLALWNGRITHTPEAQARNPIPRTVESVETGRDLYLENCAVCHGDDARGDGDGVSELERPAADLTESHMDTHPAGDIAYWIQHGIEPAMPGLGDSLTEEEVWHLVNYLRSLRHPVE